MGPSPMRILGYVNVSKETAEALWYLPGVAEHFGMYVFSSSTLVISSLTCGRSDSLLRCALFEDMGGMYLELITHPDIKVFLPPIGGLTVYICKSHHSNIIIPI